MKYIVKCEFSHHYGFYSNYLSFPNLSNTRHLVLLLGSEHYLSSIKNNLLSHSNQIVAISIPWQPLHAEIVFMPYMDSVTPD